MALNYASFTITNGGGSSLTSYNTTSGMTSYSEDRATPTTNNVVDEEIVITVVTPAFTAGTGTYIAVYAVGSVDGTTWPDGMTPQTASSTVTLSANGNNMRFLGTIPCTVSAGTFTSNVFNIAPAFGGSMPPYYAICLQNYLTAGSSVTSASVTGRTVYFN